MDFYFASPEEKPKEPVRAAFNDENPTIYNLHCWKCVEKNEKGMDKKGKAPKGSSMICRGQFTRFIYDEPLPELRNRNKRHAKYIVHLTTSDPELSDATYVKARAGEAEELERPYRIHCKKCRNLLGTVLVMSGKLRPRFHHQSVIFVNETGSKLLYDDWRSKVEEDPVARMIEREHVGPTVFVPKKGTRGLVAIKKLKGGSSAIMRTIVDENTESPMRNLVLAADEDHYEVSE